MPSAVLVIESTNGANAANAAYHRLPPEARRPNYSGMPVEV